MGDRERGRERDEGGYRFTYIDINTCNLAIHTRHSVFLYQYRALGILPKKEHYSNPTLHTSTTKVCIILLVGTGAFSEVSKRFA